MLAEILATGDEIRSGALVDSNSAYIADELTRSGVEVTRHHAVGDDLDMLVAVLQEISARADVAVVTGGLGPTEDDLTTEAAARAGDVELVFDPRAMQEIEAFFKKRKRSMTPTNRKQAYLPQGAGALYNSLGTAPGFRMTIGHCTFFCLPGVPPEMKAMLAEQVLPQIGEMQGGRPTFCLIRTLSTFGLPESTVGEKVAGLNRRFPQIKLGLRAKFPEIQVRLYLNTTAENQGQAILDQATQWVRERVGPYLFSTQGKPMAAVVGELLRQRHATLAVAESCTGGLVADWLTNTDGSSDYFLLSAVTYANEAKKDLLGVSDDTLKQVGAVHERTAEEMAQGARRIGRAVYGLATTGIAGPTGGSEAKPVGTVCIAVAAPDRTIRRRFFFPFGRRLMNKRIFAMAALDMLRRTLQEAPVS